MIRPVNSPAASRAQHAIRVWIVEAPCNPRRDLLAWPCVFVPLSVEPGAFSKSDAETFVRSFNADARRRRLDRWAVMHKVRVVFAGDLIVGAQVCNRLPGG